MTSAPQSARMPPAAGPVATYWAAVIGEAVVQDVAWSYEDPPPESLPIKGYLSFDPARADVFAELPGR